MDCIYIALLPKVLNSLLLNYPFTHTLTRLNGKKKRVCPTRVYIVTSVPAQNKAMQYLCDACDVVEMGVAVLGCYCCFVQGFYFRSWWKVINVIFVLTRCNPRNSHFYGSSWTLCAALFCFFVDLNSREHLQQHSSPQMPDRLTDRR